MTTGAPGALATPAAPVAPDDEIVTADSATSHRATADGPNPETTVNHPGPDASSDRASTSQDQVTAEIVAAHAALDRARAAGRRVPATSVDFAPYRSSVLRHPTKDRVRTDPEDVELVAPVFGERDIDGTESDLTIGHSADPVGERMIVTGRVLDGEGRPVRKQLVEIWQANAAGRYAHKRDQHPAPLDPNFTGVGRCLTDEDGWYRFTTIKPGPYPWKNHRNAWRPAHIHFSLFGTEFTQRLVTQMYFPGDPLFDLDPIYQAVTDPRDRELLVARYDHSVTQHEWCTGYRWDVVLTGTHRTWIEPVPEPGEEH